jgi:hypothetical protein
MRVHLLAIIAANALTISQAIAQQPSNQPSGAAPELIVGQTAAAIQAEGQRTGVLQRYHEPPHDLFAEHPYYLWRGGCYIRQLSGAFYSVPIESCR